MTVTLYNRDELFVIDTDTVAFFKAEDHYTWMFFSNEGKTLLPFGMSEIHDHISTDSHIVRIGRSLLVNLDRLSHVNLLKEKMTFVCSNGSQLTVDVSKRLLKNIMLLVKEYRRNFK